MGNVDIRRMKCSFCEVIVNVMSTSLGPRFIRRVSTGGLPASARAFFVAAVHGRLLLCVSRALLVVAGPVVPSL